MKLKQIILVMLLSFSVVSAIESGFYAPFTGVKYITQGWKGATSHGGHSPRYPYALDIVDKVAGTSFDVLSVKDGTVIDKGWDNGFGNYIIIKHSSGIYSEYAHLKTINVQKGKFIPRGTIIGKTGGTGSYAKGAVHLHIQFSKKGTKSDMGRTANSIMVNFIEFSTSEVQYINTIKRIHPFTSQNSIITKTNTDSIFDGAGSIVSPNDSCWGCNRDDALMHEHIGFNSTVVFQWLYDKNSCSELNLYSDTNEKLKVLVHSKKWNSHTTQIAETMEISKNSPATIRRADRTNRWTTFAVTTEKPISKDIHIRAYCADKNEPYHNANRSIADKSLVDVSNDYFWTGTASLISQSTKPKNTFGKDKDWAVTFDSHKSLTSFQWDTTTCKEITITNGETLDNPVSSNVSVDIKGWNEAIWDENVCDELPCTLNKYSDAYYILKIKSAAGVISKKMIQVKCRD